MNGSLMVAILGSILFINYLSNSNAETVDIGKMKSLKGYRAYDCNCNLTIYNGEKCGTNGMNAYCTRTNK